MDLDDVHGLIVAPALTLLPRVMDTRESQVMLLAIGRQESRFAAHTQHGGPARGFWQFEHGGGVVGVIRHPASAAYMRTIAERLCYACDSARLYHAMAYDSLLACVMARLLLWTDPYALPSVDNVDGAWDVYERVWRPGRPRRETWADCHARARAQLC